MKRVSRGQVEEKARAQTMKAKQREKVRPKAGKLDIDYQVLHDAFFKCARERHTRREHGPEQLQST